MDIPPWKVQKALFQFARSRGIDPKRVPRVLGVLPALIRMSGSFSHSHRVVRDVGKVLLMREVPTIIVPVCPAYSHRKGVYTYQGLGEGIPLLVKAHLPFLQRVQKLLPTSQVRILLADHEASIPELCTAMGISQEEFSRRVARSIIATQRLVRSLGWEVLPMTAFVFKDSWRT